MFQVWYHLKVLWELKSLRDEMVAQINYYSQLDYDNLPNDVINQLTERSKKYHKAKKRSKIIMSDLQTQNLFEGFFESAPQACLQLSIIFTYGRSSVIQLISVTFSLISLAMSATHIYLTMPTKGNVIQYPWI